MPLLPPSSSKLRPRRSATVVATLRPMRTLPVALTSGTSGEAESAAPISARPSST